MPRNRVRLPLPLGGVNTSAGYENQPPNTTRRSRNARPRDWADGGVARLSQRPGIKSVVDTGSGSEIRHLAGVNVTSSQGTSSIVASVAKDEFDNRGSDTSVGVLGDFDGDGSADWKVFENSTARLTYFDPEPIDWENPIVLGLTWDQPYTSSGTGVFVDNSESSVVDNRQDGDETGTSAGEGSGRIAACYFDPSDTDGVPTDNYSLKLNYTTKSSFVEDGLNSLIGLVCHGDASNPSDDGAFGVYIGFRKDSQYNGRVIAEFYYGYNNSTDLSEVTFRNPDTTRFAIAENGIDTQDDETTEEWQLSNVITIEASTQYEYEIRKFGTRVEVYHGGVRYFVIPDITMLSDGQTTPVNTEKTATGFVINSIGTVANGMESASPLVASIDSFEISEAELDTNVSENKIIAVSDRDVYFGTMNSISVATDGSFALKDSEDVMIIPGPGNDSSTSGPKNIYFLDGTNYKKLSLNTGVVSDWTAATAGTLPQGTFANSRKAKYGVLWNGRITLFGVREHPNVLYLGRVGDPEDWDVTPTVRDGEEPVSIPFEFPISAAIPYDSDILLVASPSRMQLISGDPALTGSTRLNVTGSVGCVNQFAWAQDDEGVVYFVSTYGLHAMPKGTRQPLQLSEGRYDSFFRSIDHSKYIVRCEWSSRYNGLLILVCARGTNEVVDHVWWDKLGGFQNGGGFWPDSIPEDIGPSCSGGIDSSDETVPDTILIGGKDGVIYSYDASTLNDGGDAIESYVDIGPMTSGSNSDIQVMRIDSVTGSTSSETDWSVYRAESAEGLYSGPARIAGSWTTTGDARSVNRRLRGRSLLIRVGNDGKNERWSLETLHASLSGLGNPSSDMKRSVGSAS